MQDLAPIILFVYNRLDHTKRTINSLLKNSLAIKSDLIIYADGPKNENDLIKVTEVQEYVKTIEGFKSITINTNSINKGLANSIVYGVSETLNKYESCIVFEDDLECSPTILNYFNDALNRYKENEKVMHIGAYMYPINAINLPETFFFRVATSWGWATWKRAWNHFEPDISVLEKEFTDDKIKLFSFNGSMNFWKQFQEFKLGKNNSWAIRWYASIFLRGGLALHPAQSLVHNIGNDGSGVHSRTTNEYAVDINQNRITFFPDRIEENKEALTLIKEYYKNRKGNLLNRIIRYLNK